MSKEIINSFQLQVAMRTAVDKALEYRNPFLTPEHLVCAIFTLNSVGEALREMSINVEQLVGILDRYIRKQGRVPGDEEYVKCAGRFWYIQCKHQTSSTYRSYV